MNSTNKFASDEAFDARLRGEMRAGAYPPTPKFSAPAAQALVRQRNRAVRAMVGVSVAVAATIGALVAWPLVSPKLDASGGKLAQAQGAALPSLQAESEVLFAAPPVDGLDLLAGQQVAMARVLDQMTQEP